MMKCKLVDVFASEKLSGNGLTIFYDYEYLTNSQMHALTREMRQFESIFVSRMKNGISARIFTLEEELDFAGHPLLGLALHLHEELGCHDNHEWDVELNSGSVKLESSWKDGKFITSMHQGPPVFSKTLSNEESTTFYRALNIASNLASPISAEVVSTGLAYVILPVREQLEFIEFKVSDLTPLLTRHQAKFLYVLDIDTFEGRTWDNFGRVEDVATGSAAGAAAAFLFKNKLTDSHHVTIEQGRFVGRPSKMQVELLTNRKIIKDIKVSGQVIKIADMRFH